MAGSRFTKYRALGLHVGGFPSGLEGATAPVSFLPRLKPRPSRVTGAAWKTSEKELYGEDPGKEPKWAGPLAF